MLCKCGREAIYERRNEGKAYCKKCFTKFVEKNVKRVIGKNKLIEKDDIIAVGLSGGKDSSLLLYILKKFFKNKIFAIIIDEGIGEYREKSIEKGIMLCKTLNVEYKIISFKEYFGFGMSDIVKIFNKKGIQIKPCTFCGVLRRYILNREARKKGATKLAVGINLDDEAESALMNFIRGDTEKFLKLGALPGLIKNKYLIQRIKPLVNLSSEEIILYNKINKIPFYNKKKCPYAIDSVRLTIRKILSELEEKYPGTKYQVISFSEKIRKAALKGLGYKEAKNIEINMCKKCKEPTSREICKACELLERIRALG
jgi:uncharacterized protein (TIGR00269 family)